MENIIKVSTIENPVKISTSEEVVKISTSETLCTVSVTEQINTIETQEEVIEIVTEEKPVIVETFDNITINNYQVEEIKNHSELENLNSDDHLQYLLLSGRDEGQTITGGKNSGDSLTFKTTSHSAKGHYVFEELNSGIIKSDQDGVITSEKLKLDSEVSGILSIENGGTGNGSYTNGQLLIGNSQDNKLNKSTLTSGDGINILNGNGSITISSTGKPPTETISNSLFLLLVNKVYISDSDLLVNFVLPVSSEVGDFIKIIGKGVGGWKLSQNSSQQILFGDCATSYGENGELFSFNFGDCLEMICLNNDTIWRVVSSLGNIQIK